ncbi:MAG TPA: hypothetical protein VNV16_01205 [Methylibium sp.]|nr:hypothetical protein [Methylibium sp.]
MTLDVQTQRHRADVLECLRRGRQYLDDRVAALVKRGRREQAQQLWTDVRQQHELGNTGQANEWKEPRHDQHA